jgi:hypothetical protein
MKEKVRALLLFYHLSGSMPVYVNLTNLKAVSERGIR